MFRAAILGQPERNQIKMIRMLISDENFIPQYKREMSMKATFKPGLLREEL